MSKYFKVYEKGKAAWKALTGGKQKTTGTEVISSVKTNVPKTKYEKTLRDLKIQTQKTKASGAKLRQTLSEVKTGEYKKSGFTFGEDKKRVTKKSKKKD